MLGSSLLGQRLGFDSRCCPEMQCRAGPCLRDGGGGFFVLAKQVSRKERTQKRHRTIRSKVEGRPDRPRLAVYRSNNHIYAQVIDDFVGHTLVAASTLTPEIRAKLNGSGGADKGAAQLVGQRIAELCLAKDISDVSFDRGGNVYHGRVKALADAARETGLSF